jgi:hypothetical protein
MRLTVLGKCNTEELARIVEQKRQELKDLYDRACVLRIFTNFLALWQFRDKKHGRRSRAWYLNARVTHAIPQREVPPAKVGAILHEEIERLGLE